MAELLMVGIGSSIISSLSTYYYLSAKVEKVEKIEEKDPEIINNFKKILSEIIKPPMLKPINFIPPKILSPRSKILEDIKISPKLKHIEKPKMKRKPLTLFMDYDLTFLECELNKRFNIIEDL